MNTAARMEHTGKRDCIQLSQDTADLLIAAGKANWLSQREDVVNPKGKGEMQTYWLELNAKTDSSSVLDASSSAGSEKMHEEDVGGGMSGFDAKAIRLIEWNVDVLLRLLKLIEARRRACLIPEAEATPPHEARFTMSGQSTIDEIKEIVALPKFRDVAVQQEDPEEIELNQVVVRQLHDYVCNIAAIYRDNPFHNFEVRCLSD